MEHSSSVSQPAPQRLLRSRWAAIGAAVAVSLGGGGLLAASASDTTATLTAITPCRVIDTRAFSGIGPRQTPIAAGETYAAQITGDNGECKGIPAGATAVQLNVVEVNPTADSYLTVFPADVGRPNAATLNWVARQAPTPNASTAKLSADGRLAFFNFAGTVDVVVDVVGYYVAGSGAPGPQGPAGPRGVSAWDTIPHGQTITGEIDFDVSAAIALSDYISIDLPGRAPVALTSAVVNFAKDASAITTDDDASCTGTPLNPTAPTGKVCIYTQTGGIGGITAVTALSRIYLADTGFLVQVAPTASGTDEFLYGTWAYTAP